MKRTIPLLSLLVFACFGCAQTAPLLTEVDTVKVAQVERNAKLNNIQVIWLNYPQRTLAMR